MRTDFPTTMDSDDAHTRDKTAAPPQPLVSHKLLIMESGSGRGGSSIYLDYLLRFLDTSRFNASVGFYASNSGPDTKRLGERVPVLFFDEPPHRKLRRAFEIVSTIRALHSYLTLNRVELVLLNNDLHYHVPAIIAGWLAGVPIVCRKAGGVGEAKWIRKILARFVDLFITVSEATERDQLAIFNRPGRTIRIYEGVALTPSSIQETGPALRKRFGIPEDAIVIGNASRFREGKGQLVLVQAAARIFAEFPKARLVLFGDDASDGGKRIALQVRTLAQKLGIEDKIYFPGWIENSSSFLPVVDIFAHCPTSGWIEGLGIANLEAMAAGIPTIVSDNGGLVDAVVDGKTGFVVPQEDPEAVADAITRLIKNPELAATMGQAAKARVNDRFDMAKNTWALETALLSVLSDTGDGGVQSGRKAERPSPTSSPTRSKFLTVLSIAIFAAALVLAYGRAVAWLFHIWTHDREYSYGFLIPLIAAFLAWRKFKENPGLELRPSFLLGLPVILFAGLMLVAGRAGGYVMAEALSLIVIIPGILLAIGGRSFLWTYALPVAYLQFMVPWMDEIVERIHMPFQLLSARIATFLLNLFGIATSDSGRFLLLPHFTMEVATECSGVRFLIAVITLGTAAVSLRQKTFLRGLAVLSCTLFLTILSNGLRVALAGVMGHNFGVALLHGPAHFLQGWFVSFVGIVALLLINHYVAEHYARRDPASMPSSASASRHGFDVSPPRLLIVAATIVIVALIANSAVPVAIPPKQPLSSFPATIGPFTGVSSNWISGESLFPGVDQAITRRYESPDHRQIYLYVGYFDSQKQDKSLVNRNANVLWAGQPSDALGAPVAFANLPLEGRDYTVMYWYQSSTSSTNSRYATKLRQLTGTVFNHGNNGAVIMCAMAADGQESRAEQVRRLEEFRGRLSVLVRQFII